VVRGGGVSPSPPPPPPLDMALAGMIRFINKIFEFNEHKNMSAIVGNNIIHESSLMIINP
jgi:hypothetical protein